MQAKAYLVENDPGGEEDNLLSLARSFFLRTLHPRHSQSFCYNNHMKKYFITFILFYLKLFAKIALSIHKPYTIGIAGSVGKSSTRNAIYAVIKTEFNTLLVSQNSESGIPLGILGIEASGYDTFSWIHMLILAPFKVFNTLKHTHMIVEMGIDDPEPPKNMEYLLSIIKPDIAISLNIAGPHLAQFEKTLTEAPPSVITDPVKRRDFVLDKMAYEDTKIISKSGCEVAIYNTDDKFIQKYVIPQTTQKVLAFGKSAKNNVSYLSYGVSLDGTEFEFKTQNKTIKLEFKNLLLPKEYEETFAAAILCAQSLGMSNGKIKNNLEKNFVLPKGRASMFKGINNSVIIDSSYNAPKKAVLAFLGMATELKKQTKRKVVFLFGDMRELGEESKIEHDEVSDVMLGIVDELYCVGELTSLFVIPKVKTKIKSKHFANSYRAGEFLKENLSQNSIVLVKGSQNTIFLEEAVKLILKNSSDEKNLTRQENYWRKIKSSYLGVKI